MSAAPGYLEALNPRQREAVLHYGPPLLILAGAGSGKTRVITTKIAYLVESSGVDPCEILAVAFTNKAAEEMRERVAALCPRAEAVTIRTFHSFGAWLLRSFHREAGLPRYFTIYDEEGSQGVLRDLYGRRLTAGSLKSCSAALARAKDRCLAADDPLEALPEALLPAGLSFAELYRDYQEALRRSGTLDFGDLILQAVRLLAGSTGVREAVRHRFRVLLVDEYQDSNPAQFRLLEELYQPEGYLCVVGDEDQSIYAFRGAEVGNILTFADRFPETQIIRLEQNYRSTCNILRVASHVVAHNHNRLGKNLWTDNPEGPPVVLALLQEQDQEARFCADILRDGVYGASAILYRMNFQSRAFETLFTELGIPFRVVGTARFYDREEVRDALAYLTLLLNPHDRMAFRRAATKPRRGIGARSLERIEALAVERGLELLEASRAAAGQLGGRTARGLGELLAVMDELVRAVEVGEETLSRVVQRLLHSSGLLEHYRERDEAEGSDRAANLEELVNATARHSGNREGLSLYLESQVLNATDENPYRSGGAVTLITVHNTKGLEFDRVILTGLEDGIFPHYAATPGRLAAAGEDLEEERRLFYVAVTRARESLYLTSCRRRRVFGTFQASEPSLFLKEIPREAVQIYGGAAPQEVDSYPLGCGVYHDDYGAGVVVKRWMAAGQPMAVVRFDTGRVARFPLRYSRLERISREP